MSCEGYADVMEHSLPACCYPERLMPRLTGAGLAARDPTVANAICAPFARSWEELDRAAPPLAAHPRLTFAAATGASLAAAWYYKRHGP